MNFKVIAYKCSCRYIHITDPEKRILKKHYSKCPEHRVLQKSVLLWCKDCGLKIKTSPKAGTRRTRCQDCSEKRRRGINKKAWRTKYKGKYNHSRKVTKLPMTRKDAIEAWYQDCRSKFLNCGYST